MLAGCAAPQSPVRAHFPETTWSEPRTFSGRFDYAFEVMAFTPAGSRERWWLGGNSLPITRHLVAPIGAVPAMRSPVFVTVEGRLSSPGMHGHLGAYIRELQVTRVISVLQSP